MPLFKENDKGSIDVIKVVTIGGNGVTSRAADAGADKAVEEAGAGASKAGGAPAAAERARTMPFGCMRFRSFSEG